MQGYIDDIYLVMDDHDLTQDLQDAITSFETNCYPSGLSLKDTPEDEFLECKTMVHNHQLQIKHWNKNHEHLQQHGSQLIYTQLHKHSNGPNHCKRGSIIGTWTRMSHNCNRDELLLEAIQEKTLELLHLGYSKHDICRTLRYMAEKTKNKVWIPHTTKNMGL